MKLGALCWNQYTDWPGAARSRPAGGRGRAGLAGYRHPIAGFPSPYDEESMMRFATEVRPILPRG